MNRSSIRGVGRTIAVVLVAAGLVATAPLAVTASVGRQGSTIEPARADTPAPTAKPTPRPTPRVTPEPVRPITPGGSPETPTLTVGYRRPDLVGEAPLLLATLRGYFHDSGFTDVTLVPTSDGIADIQSGRVNVAVVDTVTAAKAAADGVPVRVIAGYRNYARDVLGLAPGVKNLKDLAGKKIVLGASTDGEDVARRTALLAEQGWDLANAGATVTTIDGGPASWLKALTSRAVAMAPILETQRQQLINAGGSLIVDAQPYGLDVLVASSDLVANQPGTVDAFLQAYIAALQGLAGRSSDPELFKAAADAGIKLNAADRASWPQDAGAFSPYDGGIGSVDRGGGLGEFEVLLAKNGVTVADPSTLIAEDALTAAQAESGLQPNPTAPLVAGKPSIVVGYRTPDLAGRAPFLLAQDRYLGDLGITNVRMDEVEQAIPGVVNGQYDFAVVDAADAASGVAQGLPIRVIAGYRLHDGGSYTGDVIIANTDLLASDPQTVQAFLRGYLRSVRDIAEPANDADVFRLARAVGIPVSASVQQRWRKQAEGFAPYDGGFGPVEDAHGLGELDTYLASKLQSAPDPAEFIAIDALQLAQATVGERPNPDITPLVTPGATSAPEASAAAGSLAP
jgi:ABC-type nitrate/sulfonate/bicarbonate transport system substrate-binding protein